MQPEPFDLSPREAARIVGCHEDTLKRWAADRKVNAFRTPGGWWRFRRSDLEALMSAPLPSCPTCTVPTFHGDGKCPNAEPVAS